MEDTQLDETIELLKTQLLLRPNDAQKRYMLGNAYRRQQRFEEAVASFRRAIAAKPEFADAHCQLGITLRATGDLEAALSSLDAALRFSPNLIDAQRNRAQICAVLERDEEAMTAYEAVFARDSADEEAAREAGRRRFARGDFERASELLNRAVELAPDKTDLVLLLGLSFHRIGKPMPARAALAEYIGKGGASPVAYLALVRSLVALNESLEAVATSRRGLELFPSDGELWFELGMLLARLEQLEEAARALDQARAFRPEPEVLSARAHVLVRLGRDEEAIEAFRERETLSLGKLPAPDLVALGAALLRCGRPAPASEAFSRALEIEPGDARTAVLMGKANLALSLRPEALKMLRRAEQLGDGSLDLLLAIAELQHELGLNDEALTSYSRILERHPEHALALYRVGVTSLAAGHEADALEPLRRAVRLSPSMVEAHRALAGVLMTAERPAEAAESFQRVIELAPDDVEARVGFARAVSVQGRTTEGLARLQEANRLGPGRPDVLRELANVLAAAGRTTEAIAWLEQAIEIAPADIDILSRFAELLHAAGFSDRALETISLAIEKRANRADYHLFRGKLFFEKGLDQKAREDFERANWLIPENQEISQYLGLVLARQGELTFAVDHLERLRERGRVEPIVSLTLARCLRELGKREQATEVLTQARIAHPTDAAILFALAVAYEDAGDLDSAAAAYREVTRWSIDSPEAYERAAQAYRKLDMVEEAVAAYKQHLRLRPDDATAWFELALCFDALGAHADAADAWSRASLLRPQHGATLSNLARALVRSGEPSRAVDVYRAFLQLEPSSTVELAELSALLEHLGQKAEKVELLDRAEEHAGDPRFLLERSRTRAELGDLDQAAKLFEQCMDLAVAESAPSLSLSAVVRAFRAQDAARRAPGLWPRVAHALSSLASTPNAVSDDLVDVASCLNELGACAEALSILARVVLGKTAPIRAYRMHAEALARLPHSAETTLAWERVVASEPQSIDARLALAKCFARERRRGEAVAMFQSVLRLDERNVDSLSDLGDLLEAQGDARGAAIALGTLAQVAPTVGTYVRLARVFGALGKGEERIEALASAVRLAPADAAHKLALGLAYAEAGDTRAIEVLEAALKIDSSLDEARRTLARLYQSEGESRRAAEHLEALARAGRHTGETRKALADALVAEGRIAAALDTLRSAAMAGELTDLDAMRLRAELAQKLELYTEAAAAYEAVAARAPSDVRALDELAECYRALAQTEPEISTRKRIAAAAPERAESHLELGRCLAAMGDHTGARAAFATAVQLAPKLLPALLGLAECLGATGQHRERVAVLERYVTFAPHAAPPHVMLGESFDEIGDKKGAERAYANAIERDPNLVAVRRKLADLLDQRSAWAEAAEHLRVLAEASPNAEDWYRVASLECAAGRVAEGLLAVANALKLSPERAQTRLLEAKLLLARSGPGDRARAKAVLAELAGGESAVAPNARMMLAKSHAADGETEIASRLLQAILEHEPEDCAVHLELGKLKELQGEHLDAIRHYAKAYAYGSKEASTLLAWARCLIATGSLDRAEEILEGAVAQAPNDARVHSSLGTVQYKRGKMTEAIDSFARAIRIDPGRGEYRAAIGAAYAAASRVHEAAGAYAAAIELGENTPEVRYHFGVALFKCDEREAAIEQVEALNQMEADALATSLATLLRMP